MSMDVSQNSETGHTKHRHRHAATDVRSKRLSPRPPPVQKLAQNPGFSNRTGPAFARASACGFARAWGFFKKTRPPSQDQASERGPRLPDYRRVSVSGRARVGSFKGKRCGPQLEPAEHDAPRIIKPRPKRTCLARCQPILQGRAAKAITQRGA